MDLADTAMTKVFTIKYIELRTQTRRRVPIARQFYVQFSVGDTSRSTSSGKEVKKRTCWNETLFFNGSDRSELQIKVYQRHHLGSDKRVASFTDAIGGILERLKDGVFEHTFCNNDSDVTDLSGITLRFALSAEPRGNVDADESQAAEMIARVTEGVSAFISTPAAAALFGTVADTGENLVVEVEALKSTFGVLLDKMALFNKIVADVAQIHPYASLAWSVVSAANQILVTQKNRDDRIIRLVSAMTDTFVFVDDAEPLKAIKAHIKTVTLLIQQVTECGYFITDYVKQKSFWIRTAKYAISDIDSKITDYENKFQELKCAFMDGVVVQTGITVVRMMNVVNETAETIVLDDMPYAFGARFQREKGCLPGTRESFLQEICDVMNNPERGAPRVCLLTGVAGSGKSAVAHSIARLYDEQKRLGSSYCFASTDVARRNPQNLLSTIARDLSDHDRQYKTALWEVVKDDRALRTSPSLAEQLEKFIIEPSKHLHTIGPLVVVIDALDESGDRASRRQLLSIISEKITENAFPTNLRFLITSRPEEDILAKLKPGAHIIHKRMEDIPYDIVDDDIGKFVYHSLHEYIDLVSSKTDKEWCRLLVRHSQHLFQWASTACNFIRGDDDIGRSAGERFDELLQAANTDSGHSLDGLYQTILNQLFTSENTRGRFRAVMAIILALKEPLSLNSLSALLGGDPNVRLIIKPMGSLLDGVLDEEKPIRPLHTSFRDFLLFGTRSSAFHVPIQPQHSLRLGQALLTCMRHMLRFNICDLKDSRIRNTAIPDLPSRVKKAIPPHLSYSCQYWMHHLQHSDLTLDLLNDTILFFKTYFPYWLEAISLLSLSSPISPILSALETCTILKKWAQDSDLFTLASEASVFIQAFTPILRESTPHIYLSAMAQTPSSSPLHTLWLNHLQKNVSVSSALANWPTEIYTLQGHTDSVFSVAYSPDGAHVVSGSEDTTIRIWNATTGLCVLGPLQGHLHEVRSVAYSPDGSHIVSGSRDETIRVWDTTTGQCVAGPFKGHTSCVYSVAYSPDGTHIISGSADKTIRIWDSINGQCVAGPFQGHTDHVCFVAFSPNGKHIVSSSNDKTIRIWNATNGHCVAGPFKGHTDKVYIVTYSPDGRYVASGSKDKTIRVWDVTTGQCIAGAFEGHLDEVWSVAYSPDGKYIISGSRDNTIRIWDSATGQSVADPFQGHTNTVYSLAYSPDGTHIMSGSADRTLRLWNANISPFAENSSQRPIDLVMSVAYSPDGSCIISGSQDKTMDVWNATTGQPVAGPLEGHTDVVSSVAYSPDGTHIISGSWDGTIWLWSGTTYQCIQGPFLGHIHGIYSAIYSPDGNHIISGSGQNTIGMWNATTAQPVASLFNGHTGCIYSIAYSPDGSYIVSGSEDKTVRVWNAGTGLCVTGPLQGHTAAVHSVAYSFDGSYVVSGSEDKTIRVWDAAVSSGQYYGAGPFHGHTGVVWCVACSPDGIHIASGSQDRTIRLWNATTGQCIAGPFQSHLDHITSLAYSPDGNHLVTGSWDCSLKVWKTQELASIDNFYEQNGWISSSKVGCFGWIAPWNRHAFQLPFHSLVISSHKVYQVDLSDTYLGESWTSCWN